MEAAFFEGFVRWHFDGYLVCALSDTCMMQCLHMFGWLKCAYIFGADDGWNFLCLVLIDACLTTGIMQNIQHFIHESTPIHSLYNFFQVSLYVTVYSECGILHFINVYGYMRIFCHMTILTIHTAYIFIAFDCTSYRWPWSVSLSMVKTVTTCIEIEKKIAMQDIKGNVCLIY